MIVISKMITYHVLALIHSITLGEHDMARCGLHDFTNKKRKTKKGDNAIKGWSVKAKWYEKSVFIYSFFEFLDLTGSHFDSAECPPDVIIEL
jgi:hypothetical protein